VQATAAFFQTAYRLYYDDRLFPTTDEIRVAGDRAGMSSIVPASHAVPNQRP
jgi:hypothetical protein